MEKWQLQWRRKGYWSPGRTFATAEEADAYGLFRAAENCEGYRVVELSKNRDLSIDQLITLLKWVSIKKQGWRDHLQRWFNGGTEPEGFSQEELDWLMDINLYYPKQNFADLTVRRIRAKLRYFQYRQAAVNKAAPAATVYQDAEVDEKADGAWVQAWVWVPREDLNGST